MERPKGQEKGIEVALGEHAGLTCDMPDKKIGLYWSKKLALDHFCQSFSDPLAAVIWLPVLTRSDRIFSF